MAKAAKESMMQANEDKKQIKDLLSKLEVTSKWQEELEQLKAGEEKK